MKVNTTTTSTKMLPMMVVNGPCDGPLNCSWPDPGEAQPYPICTKTWGDSHSALSALDLAALSWIAYEQNETDIETLLNQTFGQGVELVSSDPYNSVPRMIAVRFHPDWKRQATNSAAKIESRPLSGRDTLVVAVKGTSTLQDGYLDTDLFATIKLLQYFEFIAPVLKIMPADLVQWMLKMVKVGAGAHHEIRIWDTLAKNITKLQEAETASNKSTTFVLTGHSLGGGLAEIVAARKGLAALVWSAPGTLYSDGFFSSQHNGSVSSERMQRNIVAVMPDNDAVPRVDMQNSVVQRIQCFKKDHMPVGFFDGTATCHPIVKSGCEVWRVCGDPMQRDFSQSCDVYMNASERGKLYPVLARPILYPGEEA